VHRVDRVEHCLGEGLDRRDGAEVAGVAEHHVDLPPARHRGVHAISHLIGAGHVGRERRCAAAVEVPRGLLEIRLPHVDEHHLRAFGEERARGRGADAAGAAGDDTDLVFENRHASGSLFQVCVNSPGIEERKRHALRDCFSAGVRFVIEQFVW